MKFKRRYYPLRRSKAEPPPPLLKVAEEALSALSDDEYITTLELAAILEVITGGKRDKIARSLVRYAKSGQAFQICRRRPIIAETGFMAGREVMKNFWHKRH